MWFQRSTPHPAPVPAPAYWRRVTLPTCPACREGGEYTVHTRCPKNGDMWIDLRTGTQHCQGCGDTWSVGQGRHNCSCGAIFEGGQLWQGMHAEWGQVGGLPWVRALGLTKGSLATRLVGWHRCQACHTTSLDDDVTVLSLEYGGLCLPCLRPCVAKLHTWFHRTPDGDCDYCGRTVRQAARLIRAGQSVICDACVARAVDALR